MHKVKLLLARGSPRCYIPAVEEANANLHVDRIIPQYYHEYPAYKIMRNFFLDNPVYTHLVLATDDIVVQPSHLMRLQYDLERDDFPVLSGMMNVNLDDKVFVNLTESMPSKKRNARKYVWMTRNDLVVKDDIFPVAFSGFPLMAIRRDVVEQITFDADKVWEGQPDKGASLDIVFCWNCMERNILVMVDKTIDMLHLRTAGGLNVGTLPKKLVFWPAGEEPVELKPEPMSRTMSSSPINGSIKGVNAFK